MNDKRLVNAFVIAKCLEDVGFAWSLATYTLFLASIGLDPLQLVGTNMVFMVVRTLLDPLTGNLGDRIDQKKVYLAGLLVWGLGLGIYGLATNFWMCVVAEAVAGMGYALRSEALESWLKNRVDEETMKLAQSRSGTYGQLALIPTAILGAMVGATWGLQWPWFMTGITSILCLGVTWWQLKEYPDKVSEHQEDDSDLNVWVITKRAWSEQVTRRIFMFVALMAICTQPFNMYWSFVFEAASGEAWWLGSIWIGIAGLGALGSKLSEKLPISSKVVALITVSMGVPMLWPQFTSSLILLVAFFLLHEVGRGMVNPILWGYFNRTVDDRTRTTQNSLKSASMSTGATVGLLLSGVLVKVGFTYTQVWAIAAIALLVIALWVYRWNHD